MSKLSYVTRRGMLRRSWCAGLVALAPLLDACRGLPPSSRPSQPGTEPDVPTAPPPVRAVARGPSSSTLFVGVVAEPVTLDSAQTLSHSDDKVANNLFEGLVQLERGTFQVVPALAYSWDVAADFKSYVFSLRRGITFHDRTPFNAAAAKFSIDRQIDENHPYFRMGNFPYRKSRLGTIASTEAIGDATLRINLTRPFASFLDYLAEGIVPMVSPTAAMQLNTSFGDRPVGTGPFRFATWDKGQRLVLERNPDYWGGTPKLERVVSVTYADTVARCAALHAGELHLIEGVPAEEVQAVQTDQTFQIIGAPSPHVWYVVLNTRVPPLGDLRVRQALNHAVDKAGIIRNILGGLPIVADGPLSPAFGTYRTDDIARYPYDVPMAKSLLNAAGYPNGFDLVFSVPESGNGMQQPIAMAKFIQSNLAQVGVNVHLATFEWGAYQRVRTAGAFQMAAFSWTSAIGNPDVILYQKFHSSQIPPNGYNNTFYADPELDKLLDDARVNADDAQRREDYKQAQQRICEAATHIFVDHDANLVAATSRLQGFKVSPGSQFVFAPEIALV